MKSGPLTVVLFSLLVPFFISEFTVLSPWWMPNALNGRGVSAAVPGSESAMSGVAEAGKDRIKGNRDEAMSQYAYMRSLMVEGSDVPSRDSSAGVELDPSSENAETGDCAPEASSEIGRFASFDVCDLKEPHRILGLFDPASSSPASIQAVWVAYYSRVIVAERQHKDFSLYKLYCSAMATKKLLYEKDPDKYFRFAPGGDKFFGAEGDPEGEAAALIEKELTESVEMGNEVDAMLLHPDIFDSSVATSLMTLGWEEMKFYQAEYPVWMEWLQDESEDRKSLASRIEMTLGKISVEIEHLANDSIRAGMEMERLRPRIKHMSDESWGSGRSSSQSNENAKKGSSAAAEDRDAVISSFRLLEEEHKQQEGMLEKTKKEVLAIRDQNVKVYDRWERQRVLILSRWQAFLRGALERTARNARVSGGETWEESLKWIADKYSKDPEGSRDECEGYLLEAVLEINKARRVGGGAWSHQAEKNAALKEIVTDYNNGNADIPPENDVVLLSSYSTEDDDNFQVNNEEQIDNLDEELVAKMEDIVDELLHDGGGLGIDIDDIINELVELNEADLYSEIFENADSPEAVEAAAAAVLKELEGVFDDMVMVEESVRDMEIGGIDELVALLMEAEDLDEAAGDIVSQSIASEASKLQEASGNSIVTKSDSNPAEAGTIKTEALGSSSVRSSRRRTITSEKASNGGDRIDSHDGPSTLM